MHIAIASDKNYLIHAATLIRSICENNRGNNIVFHILTMDKNVEEDEKLRTFIDENAENNATILIHYIPENHPFIQAIPDGCAIQSRSAFLRFLAPELIQAEKILYLDCDMLVLDSLDPLFEIEMDEKILAVVPDLFGSARAYAKGFGLQYFNSGMVLFNVSRWKADRSLDRTLKFLTGKFNEIFAGKKNYGDQDVLNILFQGQVVYVHPKYNAVNPLFLRSPDFRGEILKEAHDRPVVVHFAGGAKPWNRYDFHPLSGEYWKYRQLTPWNNISGKDSENISAAKMLFYYLKRLKFSLRFFISPFADIVRRVYGYPSRIVSTRNIRFLMDLTSHGPAIREEVNPKNKAALSPVSDWDVCINKLSK